MIETAQVGLGNLILTQGCHGRVARWGHCLRGCRGVAGLGQACHNSNDSFGVQGLLRQALLDGLVHTLQGMLGQQLQHADVLARAGLSTVIDVVATEEALTQAQLGRIRNQLQCALALARLRFELGALPATETEADAQLSVLAGPASSAAGAAAESR